MATWKPVRRKTTLAKPHTESNSPTSCCPGHEVLSRARGVVQGTRCCPGHEVLSRATCYGWLDLPARSVTETE
ncbi:hypothetical protein ACOMHN_010233 [Nucella lapillus]